MNVYRLVLFGMVTIFSLMILSAGCVGKENGEEDPNGDAIRDEEPYPRGSYVEPGSKGPFEVGVRTLYFIDHSRFMEYGKTPRTLVTEIWYPLARREGKVNTIQDMLGPIPDWAIPIARRFYGDGLEDLLSIQTDAIRDAEPFVPDHPFPLIFFSHGLMAIRFQNYTLCEHLVSHGFVVVAPDHYDNALLSNIDGRILFFNPVSMVTSEIERPRDIAFLIDELERYNRVEGHFLHNLIDAERIGLSGHSYGGMTSYMAGSRVPKVDSIAPLNPVMFRDNPPGFTKPTFLLIGDNDRIAGNILDSSARAEENYHAHRGRKAFIFLKNSGHYSSTDACTLLPPGLIDENLTGCGGGMISQERANEITNAYLTAFFSVTLKQDDRYLDYLLTNQDPSNMDYDVHWDRD